MYYNFNTLYESGGNNFNYFHDNKQTKFCVVYTIKANRDKLFAKKNKLALFGHVQNPLFLFFLCHSLIII